MNLMNFILYEFNDGPDMTCVHYVSYEIDDGPDVTFVYIAQRFSKIMGHLGQGLR